MAIVLTCACGRKLQIKDEYAGREGQCPACARTFRIPEPARDDEPAPVPPARAVEVSAPPPPAPETAAPPAYPAEQASTLTEPVPDHGGGTLPAAADFFAEAPPDIGPVLSAYTTLRRGYEPWSPGARLGLCLFLGFLGVSLALFIVTAAGARDGVWYVFWPVVFGGVGVLIGVLSTNFRYTCTYVGREGVARFTCAGTREDVSGVEVFRFRDAAELRTSQTRRYVNGAYQGTNYSYTWTDVGGRTRFVLSGTHKSEKGEPPSTDPYQFARAAEIAWTVYLLDSVYRQIELNGTVLFHLTGGQWVRLGQGFLVVSKDGGEKWGADEVAAVSLDQGVVRIRRRDAREGWFSSEGVFKFGFDGLANAQLFFHLCDKLVGVPVG